MLLSISPPTQQWLKVSLSPQHAFNIAGVRGNLWQYSSGPVSTQLLYFLCVMSACPKLSLPRGDAGSQSSSRIQGQSVIVGRRFDFICLWNFHVKGVEIQLLPANNTQQLEFLCKLFFYKVVAYRCRGLPLPLCWRAHKGSNPAYFILFSEKKINILRGPEH